MGYIVMGYTVVPNTFLAYIVIAYIAIAYIVVVYMVMAWFDLSLAVLVVLKLMSGRQGHGWWLDPHAQAPNNDPHAHGRSKYARLRLCMVVCVHMCVCMGCIHALTPIPLTV